MSLPKYKNNEGGEHWISLSDMMTALALLFLLIAVIYMLKVKDSVKVPQIYKEVTQGLSEALNKEFEQDFKKWGAVMDKNLTIRFQAPDILFDTNSAIVKEPFKEILDDFFPRYLRIMMQDRFINNIEEIRIEGHTSSIWTRSTSDDVAYFKNMALSQSRTMNVLEYIFNSHNMGLDTQERKWLRRHFRAIGFSSAIPLNSQGIEAQNAIDEDYKKSQRVEFRVRTNIEEKIEKVINK